MNAETSFNVKFGHLLVIILVSLAGCGTPNQSSSSTARIILASDEDKVEPFSTWLHALGCYAQRQTRACQCAISGSA